MKSPTVQHRILGVILAGHFHDDEPGDILYRGQETAGRPDGIDIGKNRVPLQVVPRGHVRVKFL